MPYFGLPLSREVNLGNLSTAFADGKSADVAFMSSDGSWTWEELDRALDRLALHYLALGLMPGDRIASLMPNCNELLVHYLACLKAGLVATPLNYRYTPSEIDYALDMSGASALLVHAERAGDAAASRLVPGLPRGLISFGGPLDGAARLEEMLAEPAPEASLPELDPTAPAFLFFTSGSTGKPKGVTHTLHSLGCVAASFAQAMALTPDDIVLPGASISHVGALSTALAGLSAGVPVIIARNFNAEEILPLMRKHRPTILVMLPVMLIALQRDHGAAPEDFSSLRMCITGGDKFPVNLEREFTDMTGLTIHETYGMTECPDCLFHPPGVSAGEGSVGIVSPGYAASVRNEAGHEVPPETDGNLWIQGAPMMMGYWDDREATESTIRNGWIDTGDVVRVDGGGYFRFRGRKKQTIIHDGSNISPQEIEEAVMDHPAVAMAGVVGVHDAVHGEDVWAYVTLKEGAEEPAGQDIIRHARRQVGYKAPEVILFVEEMPLNATGKVDRARLKKWAIERVSAHPG